jgi:very-short-patch-repair endonuclease
MLYPEIKEKARQLRNNPTIAESLLWKELKSKKFFGLKFLRQHPIIYESKKKEHFFFIPDFYCASKKLIIEVDGKIHNYQKNRDEHRVVILKSCNLSILRIKNEELENIGAVLKKIEQHLK